MVVYDASNTEQDMEGRGEPFVTHCLHWDPLSAQILGTAALCSAPCTPSPLILAALSSLPPLLLMQVMLSNCSEKTEPWEWLDHAPFP